VHRAAAAEKEEKKKAAPVKKGKQARVWGDAPSGKEDAALDFTDGTPAEAATVAADFKQKSLIDVDEDISYDEEEEEEEATAAAPKKGGLLSSFVRSIGVNVVGTQVRCALCHCSGRACSAARRTACGIWLLSCCPLF
jgi:superfamily II DNA or RNA helicase